MRKYLKPALEIEAFDVEDVITASGTTGKTIDSGTMGAAAPIIDVIELN